MKLQLSITLTSNPRTRPILDGTVTPDGIDLIKNGAVQLLINTPLGERAQRDDYTLRQAAIAARLPYTTTLSAARAAVDAIHAQNLRTFEVRSLQEWHQESAKS